MTLIDLALVLAAILFYVLGFRAAIRLAKELPRNLSEAHVQRTFLWVLLFVAETITILSMVGSRAFCDNTDGLWLVIWSAALFVILYKEFRRNITGGHKPFVNPWCDDIAVECQPPGI